MDCDRPGGDGMRRTGAEGTRRLRRTSWFSEGWKVHEATTYFTIDREKSVGRFGPCGSSSRTADAGDGGWMGGSRRVAVGCEPSVRKTCFISVSQARRQNPLAHPAPGAPAHPCTQTEIDRNRSNI